MCSSGAGHSIVRSAVLLSTKYIVRSVPHCAVLHCCNVMYYLLSVLCAFATAIIWFEHDRLVLGRVKAVALSSEPLGFLVLIPYANVPKGYAVCVRRCCMHFSW